MGISNWSEVKKANIYAIVLVAFAAIPVWFTLGIPLTVAHTTQGFYDSINNLSEDDIIVFGWQSMRIGDYRGNEHIFRAIFSLIHAKNLKILCLSLGSGPPIWFVDIYESNNLVEIFDLTYGVDYVITPYIAGEEAALATFAADAHSVTAVDLYGTLIGDLPLMQRIHTLDDIDLCWGSSYAYSNVDQFVRQWGVAYNKGFIWYPGMYWSVAYAYPYPLMGVLDGNKGKAEFENMTGYGGKDLAKYESASTGGLAFLCFLFGGFAYQKIIKPRKEAEQ